MELKGKRLVLIGGAGLIGSHIADLLCKTDVGEIVIFDNFVRGKEEHLADALADERVRVVRGDILDRDALAKVIEGADGVFLRAALWLLQCAEDPLAGRRVNVEGNLNVVEACRVAGVKRLVFSSSASVYGDALTNPMTEDHPLNNRTFYGATKVAMEQMLRAYHQMYQLPYVALRYFNVYGPRQDYKGAYVNVIMKTMDRLDRGEPPLVFGDGSQAYDFIFVEDIARANIAAMRAEATDEAFNIATGVRTSILDLVKMLIELYGVEVEPEFRPAPQTFVIDRLGSVEKARELLQFEATVALREGLERLIEWRRRDMRQGEAE